MRFVLGGQIGADRAALDVALELGIDHGGWMPKGCAAEDGPLPVFPPEASASTTAAARLARARVRASPGA